MQGQIAGATPLSQLFIYMNNCMQFWIYVYKQDVSKSPNS